MVLDLRAPFAGHVLEGGGGHDAEADQEHVRLGVGQRTKSEIKIMLMLQSGNPLAASFYS